MLVHGVQGRMQEQMSMRSWTICKGSGKIANSNLFSRLADESGSW